MPKQFPLPEKLLVTADVAAYMLSVCRKTLERKRRNPRDPLSEIPVITGKPQRFHIKDVKKVAKAYRRKAQELRDSAR